MLPSKAITCPHCGGKTGTTNPLPPVGDIRALERVCGECQADYLVTISPKHQEPSGTALADLETWGYASHWLAYLSQDTNTGVLDIQ